MALATVDEITMKTFLEGEPASEVKHEFVDGQVYAMASASERHNRIALNIAFHLRAASRGGACRAFISDMLLHVPSHNAFYYPDVMLVCDPDDRESRYKSAPCLIVEVLSESTESIDRREKWLGYRQLPSLRHYLLVSQDKRQMECYSRRHPDDAWQHQAFEPDGKLTLVCESLTLRLSLADIYEDVG
ncbi:MAG: Uma2 family endonuclease [Halothiobacillaceae bacterium]